MTKAALTVREQPINSASPGQTNRPAHNEREYAMSYEEMTDAEVIAAERKKIARAREALKKTQDLMDALGKLLQQHGCKTPKELPEPARRSVLQKAAEKGLFTQRDVEEIEAYWAGGPQPKARFLAALPDSFFGPVQ